MNSPGTKRGWYKLLKIPGLQNKLFFPLSFKIADSQNEEHIKLLL